MTTKATREQMLGTLADGLMTAAENANPHDLRRWLRPIFLQYLEWDYEEAEDVFLAEYVRAETGDCPAGWADLLEDSAEDEA